MNVHISNPPAGWRSSTVGMEFYIDNHLREPISQEVRKGMKGNYPYYGPTKIIDLIDNYRVEGQYALIGEDGDHFLKYSERDMTQLVAGKFNVNNHAHLVRGKSACTTEWFYLYFRRRNLAPYLTRQGAGRYKLNKAALEKLPILIPPINEQLRMFKIISLWDHVVDLTKRLILEKQQLRKGLMQQLLTGKRRLPGFDGEWNTLRVRDILSVRNEKATQSTDEPLYSLTIENGVTPKTDRYDREALVKDKVGKTYKRVRPNDLAYNPANLRWGAIALNKEKSSVLVSPIYQVLHVTDETTTDIRFVAHMLCSDRQIAKFACQTEGSLVERMEVKIGPFLATKVDMPVDINEQRTLADFFDNTDRELDLLRAKAHALREQKKGLMQQLLTGKKRVIA